MGSPYIGEIRMFAGNFAPTGWLFCHGQLLPISGYETLFSLIGITYGGDGESTFAVPDLRGRIPIHQGISSASGRTFTLGETGGAESITLMVNQVPAHSHSLVADGQPAESSGVTGRVLAQSEVDLYAPATPDAFLAGSAVGPVGGSQPHENCMPFLCVDFIISLFGLYPSQT